MAMPQNLLAATRARPVALEASDTYAGLVLEGRRDPHVVIDSESVIIKPDVAEAHRAVPQDETQEGGAGESRDASTRAQDGSNAEAGKKGSDDTTETEKLPTRFIGTVMISADRPARDIHQIVEAIVEQLTTIPGNEVSLKLEIDAEIPQGLDRSKVRTLLENATTLGFIEKLIR